MPAALDRDLRERVWAPFARALPKGTTRLVLAPDGELSLLPFEAFRLADDRYLVESYAVSYVSTGRDLIPLPVRADLAGAVVLADPDYDTLGLPPKPGSAIAVSRPDPNKPLANPLPESGFGQRIGPWLLSGGLLPRRAPPRLRGGGVGPRGAAAR
jgi:hypothetical protein